jgi:hypothetical protein
VTHCAVIDTNVFAVAAGIHDGASEECVLACVQLLARVASGLRVAVDTNGAILSEYIGALRGSDPSVASKLAVRLLRTRFDADLCHQVDITPIDPPAGSFAEVPPILRDFDADDQKFIAVSVAEGANPPVFAALDREWWNRRVDFVASGIDVQFLCAADLV